MSKWKIVKANVSKVAWQHKHAPPPWMKEESKPSSSALYSNSSSPIQSTKKKLLPESRPTVHSNTFNTKESKLGKTLLADTLNSEFETELSPSKKTVGQIQLTTPSKVAIVVESSKVCSKTDISQYHNDRDFIETPLVAKEKLEFHFTPNERSEKEEEEESHGRNLDKKQEFSNNKNNYTFHNPKTSIPNQKGNIESTDKVFHDKTILAATMNTTSQQETSKLLNKEVPMKPIDSIDKMSFPKTTSQSVSNSKKVREDDVRNRNFIETPLVAKEKLDIHFTPKVGSDKSNSRAFSETNTSTNCDNETDVFDENEKFSNNQKIDSTINFETIKLKNQTNVVNLFHPASPFSPEKERLEYFRNFKNKSSESGEEKTSKSTVEGGKLPEVDVDCLYCSMLIENPVEISSCAHMVCKRCASVALHQRLLLPEFACPVCIVITQLQPSSLLTPSKNLTSKAKFSAVQLRQWQMFKDSTKLYIPVLRRIHQGQYSGWDSLPGPARKDLEASNILLREAAELGLPEAQHCLSMSLLRGEGSWPGLKSRARAAVEWSARAAAQNIPPAQYQLALFFQSGYGGLSVDLKRTVNWLIRSARRGHSEAILDLGVCCWEGRGLETDHSRAVCLFQKAALKGLSEAQFNLGLALWTGQGIEKSPSKAIYWYQKAAEQGNKLAQYNLAAAYKNGEGVTKDIGMASYWWSKAALIGNMADAANNLGTACWNGEIGDTRSALQWYKIAAEQNHLEAQRNYAEALLIGGQRLEAIKWYRCGAELGDAKAAHTLALIYQNGLGDIKADNNKATYWSQRAETMDFDLEPTTSLRSYSIPTSHTTIKDKTNYRKSSTPQTQPITPEPEMSRAQSSLS